MSRSPMLSRRDWLKLSAAGVVGYSLSGWLGALADEAAAQSEAQALVHPAVDERRPQPDGHLRPQARPRQRRPLQGDRHRVPGIKISEHLPKVARHMDRMAIIRSMSTQGGGPRPGHLPDAHRPSPGGPVQYPTLGSLFSKELDQRDAELPNFVSIAPYRFFSPAAYGPGFLGPQYAPLVVGENQQASFRSPASRTKLRGLAQGARRRPATRRQSPNGPPPASSCSTRCRTTSLTSAPPCSSQSQRSAYERAVTLMRSTATKAFDLDEEPKELRDRYGRNLFGQGCLLARRLVERGVPFVEVSLATVGNSVLGWDTHINNFDGVKRLSEVLDPAWATLMDDLKTRACSTRP